MSLRNTQISPRQKRANSIFETVLSASERRTLQAAAPAPLELVNDHSTDGTWPLSDVYAIQSSATRRGYRVQTRMVNGDKKRRRIWISWDPKRYDKKQSQK